jgi:D-3-phosphoglycerate dehydrogenase / 2-oxoglutarate reductase
MSFKVLTLNNIALAGLERLPRDRYEVASEIGHPDAVMVRSADMHKIDIPASVKAIARAGAGVNNIPVDLMSKRGVPVFNAPGANANAVKELVLGGMLLAARNLCEAWDYVRTLDGSEDELHRAVESGKKRFVGFELPGRSLGVVGLGAIGVELANAALALGMQVIGYDPKITVERAWQLNSGVRQAVSLDDLFTRSQVVSVHVPLVEGTRALVNAERLALMKPGGVLLNFSRAQIVDDAAVLASLDEGGSAATSRISRRSPTRATPRSSRLPHLGASTREAEENCAVMVAENLRDFLEHGNVRHSVNFPEAMLPRIGGSTRIAIANANVPNMVGQISTALAFRGTEHLRPVEQVARRPRLHAGGRRRQGAG